MYNKSCGQIFDSILFKILFYYQRPSTVLCNKNLLKWRRKKRIYFPVLFQGSVSGVPDQKKRLKKTTMSEPG